MDGLYSNLPKTTFLKAETQDTHTYKRGARGRKETGDFSVTRSVGRREESTRQVYRQRQNKYSAPDEKSDTNTNSKIMTSGKGGKSLRHRPGQKKEARSAHWTPTKPLQCYHGTSQEPVSSQQTGRNIKALPLEGNSRNKKVQEAASSSGCGGLCQNIRLPSYTAGKNNP